MIPRPSCSYSIPWCSHTHRLSRLAQSFSIVVLASIPECSPPHYSRPLSLLLSRSFSSSPNQHAKSKAQKREAVRQWAKASSSLKEHRRAIYERQKPDPVLGYSTALPQGHLAWANCELSRLILRPADVWAGSGPSMLNFGLSDAHKELLFDALPAVSSQQALLDATSFEPAQAARLAQSSIVEQSKTQALKRILDLRNANLPAITKANKRRIIEAFSPKNPDGSTSKLDPGCSEVQAAIATYRIHAILDHAWQNTRDTDARRHLSDLVMHRMKILKYLSRTQPQRYHALLPRIGLGPIYLRDELIIRAKLPLRPGESLH